MPQVWVTYAELSDHLGIQPESTREMVRAWNLDCRHSQDGNTRVKLPPDIALPYMTALLTGVAATAARGRAPFNDGSNPANLLAAPQQNQVGEAA